MNMEMMSQMDLLSVSGNWVWPKGHEPLLVTNHGDHLYGTATSSHGRMIYAVLTGDEEWTHQVTANGVSVRMIDLGSWLNLCAAGDPVALEAMFSPDVILDNIPRLRADYSAKGIDETHYLDTIKGAVKHEDPSMILHSLRLAWNLSQIRETGRMNPVLHPAQVDQYRRVVTHYEGAPQTLYSVCLRIVASDGEG